MNMECVREFDRSYMRTRIGNAPAFEEKMLEENPVKGIIAPVRMIENNADYYYFEITGLKTLDAALGRVPMTYENVRQLAFGFANIMNSMDEYLLDADNFIFDTERMYLNIPEHELFLMYCPSYNEDIISQWSKVFEKFINCIDYDDERAVDFVYKLYGAANDDGVSLKTLTEKIKHLVEENDNYVGYSSHIERCVPPEKNDENEEIEESYLDWLKKKFVPKESESKKRSKVKNKNSVSRVVDCSGEDTLYINAGPREDLAAIDNKNNTQDNDCVKTTVVFKRKKHSIVLEALDSDEEIYIDKFPFYLGSMQKYSDYVISGENISRMHAMFQRKKGAVTVVDLNSTNGTVINGAEIIPGQEMPVGNGDTVCFADMAFRVRIHE